MFRDLRTQLLLWTILPLSAILIIIAYFGVVGHQTAMRDMIYERDAALARVVAAEWSDSLATHASLLPTLDPRKSSQCDTACAAFDGGVAFFDPAGNLVTGQPSLDAWNNRAAQVKGLVAGRDSTFSTPFLDGGNPRVLVVSRRVDGSLIGAFTPPSLANLGFGPRGAAYVVNSSGIIVAHPDPTRLGKNLVQHGGIVQALRGESGATLYQDANGNELVIGYAPIAQTGWGLIIEEPWADVVDPMFQTSTLFPLVFLVVAVGALGAVFFGIRNVIRPLQDLVQAANRIAYGDFHAAEKPVAGVHEIEELRETLDRMAKQVSSAQDAMQSYVSAITRGQEEERIRLARELHDDTIQSLIALQQRVELAQKALARDPVAGAAQVADLKTLLGETLGSVRQFVRDLRPTALAELGLVAALESLTRESNAMFSVEGESKRLDSGRELVMFRIVQESLRNVNKHSKAKNVQVTLTFDDHEVTATVQDDGIGFDAPNAPADYAAAGHFGLMGMQERAQLFGGSVYVKSERGRGTKVIAYVPTRA